MSREGGVVQRSRLDAPPAAVWERLSQRRWEHERTLEPDGDGCLVTDRLRFEPRAAIPLPVVRRFVAATFAHRHRRLRAYFGGGA